VNCDKRRLRTAAHGSVSHNSCGLRQNAEFDQTDDWSGHPDALPQGQSQSDGHQEFSGGPICEAHERAARRIILDLDATDGPLRSE
jgi:hypothetical protein